MAVASTDHAASWTMPMIYMEEQSLLLRKLGLDVSPSLLLTIVFTKEIILCPRNMVLCRIYQLQGIAEMEVLSHEGQSLGEPS